MAAWWRAAISRPRRRASASCGSSTSLPRRRPWPSRPGRWRSMPRGSWRASGLGHLSKSLGTDAAWEKLLAALATEPALRTYVAQHHALWRCAQEQIVALEETLAAQPATIAKVAARLQTVPGVGPIVSLTAVAVFSDVHRFPSAKHAASYAGLVPSTDQSGDRDTHGHITKRGSAALRIMLCEA